MVRTTIARRRSFLALSTFVGATALVAACARDNREATSPAVAESFAAPAAPPQAEGFASRALVADQAAKAAAPDVTLPTSGQEERVTPGMIIRNGTVSIQVDSLEAAVAAVRALAAQLGGYVGNVSTSTGEYAVRAATLELKIPSARFDAALGGLTPVGKVEQSSSTAEDVGEEFVDVKARMTNARRLEERLVTLLATRTGKLEDVLAVERELARVREEIERYEGRLRFLSSRVAMSTLAVTVHEAAPLVNPNPGTSVLAEAVKAAWRNFVGLLAGSIAALGYLVPLGALLAAAWWRWHRRTA